MVLLRYLAQMLKARLQYRGDFWIGCLASILSQGCGLLVVLVIFEKVPDLAGWSRAEVLFIYAFALTAQASFEVVADGFYQFPDRYVFRGELDRVLLRPVHPLAQIVLENLSLESLPDLVLGITLLVWVSFGLGGITLLGVLATVGLVLCAAMVLAGVFLALVSTSFWVEDQVGILPPVYNLLAFARYPLSIYHSSLRVLLTFVLPFGFIAFYPSTGLLGREEHALGFWMTPAAAIVTLGIGVLVFRVGLRRYRSTGS